jgi:hypothetical protein
MVLRQFINPVILHEDRNKYIGTAIAGWIERFKGQKYYKLRLTGLISMIIIGFSEIGAPYRETHKINFLNKTVKER